MRQSDGYDQRLGDNEAFSKAHYVVTKWVGELPPETLSKHGDAIARLFDDTPEAAAEKGGRPSRLYIYFTKNIDRRLCIAFAIGLPKLFLWSAASYAVYGASVTGALSFTDLMSIRRSYMPWLGRLPSAT